MTVLMQGGPAPTTAARSETALPAEMPESSSFEGHRTTPLGRSPFAPVASAVLVALGFLVVAVVWLVVGDRLPGGRWLVAHLFTLGVLSTVTWAFSSHFAARFTGASDRLPSGRTRLVMMVVWTASVVAMLSGRAFDAHVPLVVGSLGIMAIVAVNLVWLRRLRTRTSATRFGFVVQTYEHAHLAFLVAAALGGALGAGWIPAGIFAATRHAHIHLNVLGWAGLTVLATLTVFGPALLRVRIEPAAERRARTAMGLAVLGLVMSAGSFFLSGIGDGAGPPRVMGVAGLALYGYGVAAVAFPLVRAALRSDRSPLRWAVSASLGWMLVTVAAGMVLGAFGHGGWPPALVTAALVGALAQLVLTVLLYVAPMLRGRSFAARDRVLARVERFARTRTLVLNLGVASVAGNQLLVQFGSGGISPPVPLGWSLLVLAVLAHVAVVVAPARDEHGAEVRSAVARRYRTTQV